MFDFTFDLLVCVACGAIITAIITLTVVMVIGAVQAVISEIREKDDRD